MKKSKYTYTIEELYEAVKTSRSYAQALQALGLNASGNAYSIIKRNITNNGIDISHFTGKGYLKGQPGKCSEKIPLMDILEGNHPQYQSHKLRIRLLDEGVFEHKCSSCNNTEWMGAPIPLELEHINGVFNDHRLVNLTLLCPNCHSQTPTHAGKNKKAGGDSRSRTDTPCGGEF